MGLCPTVRSSTIAETTFLDTNILVYAYDLDAHAKRTIAQRVVQQLWDAGTGAVSTQVLQEFYVTVTRKLSTPLPRLQAREIVSTYASWNVVCPDAHDIATASQLEERCNISFWDALIVTTARRCGAKTLLSEDLADGSTIDGVRIINPLLLMGNA